MPLLPSRHRDPQARAEAWPNLAANAWPRPPRCWWPIRQLSAAPSLPPWKPPPVRRALLRLVPATQPRCRPAAINHKNPQHWRQ